MLEKKNIHLQLKRKQENNDVNAGLVKELRDKTAAGMMDCKKALTESNGDLEEAVQILRKKGIAKAAKKSTRDANEGLIGAWVSDDQKKGVIVEVNCETDFVARNDEFKTLVHSVEEVFAQAEVSLFNDGVPHQSLLNQASELVAAAVGSMGEKLSFCRATLFQNSVGTISSYIHLGGKIGVLLDLEGDDANKENILKDICLHIAAVDPEYLQRDEVSEDVIEKEKDVVKAQLAGKPAEIMDKIISGKIEKYYSEVCLMEQSFVKDPSQRIKDVLGGLSIKGFVRFQLGA